MSVDRVCFVSVCDVLYAEKQKTGVQRMEDLELRLQKEVHTNEVLVRSIDCLSFI